MDMLNRNGARLSQNLNHPQIIAGGGDSLVNNAWFHFHSRSIYDIERGRRRSKEASTPRRLRSMSANSGGNKREQTCFRCSLCPKEKADGYELRRHMCAAHHYKTTAKPDGFTRRLGVIEESLIRLEGKEYSDYHQALFGRPFARRHQLDSEPRRPRGEQQARKRGATQRLRSLHERTRGSSQ